MNKLYLVYGDDRDAMLEAAKTIRAHGHKAHLRTLSGWVGDVENCDGVAVVAGADSDKDQATKLVAAYEGKIVTSSDFAPKMTAEEKAKIDEGLKTAAEDVAKIEAKMKADEAAKVAAAEKAEADKKAADEAAKAAAAAKAATK